MTATPAPVPAPRAGTGDAPVPPVSAGPGARPGYWFPLVVFGLFIILPVPFSSYRDTGWYAYAAISGATPGWYTSGRRSRAADSYPGARLPNELELASAYGVARLTVRRAIADLIESGHVVVLRGRGTFVRSG